MIRLIILDFDGTLGDTRANIVLTMRRTLERLGYPIPDEATIAATIGVPLEKGFEQMLPGISPDDVALCAKTYREIFEKNRKQMERDLKTLEPKDRLQILEKLMQYVIPKQQAIKPEIDFSMMSDKQLDYIIAQLAGGILNDDDETEQTTD